ncbi:UvrD-helicase domain-containing protein, partial [Anaerovibrio slackiae]
MAWTKEQQRAIDLDGKNILVSAAAGSGKTAVLAERVVSHLLRPETDEGAWNVDELLIVTFTRAAAAEMSERIGIRLQQAIAAELDREKPDRRLVSRLERQVILLSGASISTIDSFCQSIIKNNFSALDLDPKFRVADENELLLLQQDVLDELFEQRYEAMDEVLLHLGEQ